MHVSTWESGINSKMQASEGFIMLLFTTKIITLKLTDLREQAFKPILRFREVLSSFPSRYQEVPRIYTVDLNNPN